MGGQSLIHIVEHITKGVFAMKLIKCITKGEVKAIINKYRTTEIVHDNLIRIYEAGHFINSNGFAHVYVLMEFILGHNLDQIIK